MQNTTHTKLEAIDAKIKRWQSRLTRASNMIVKLAKQRRRLTKNMATVSVANPKAEPKPPTPAAPTVLGPNFTPGELVEPKAVEISKAEEKLDLPKVLDRRDPKIKAELEATREAAKKKMPLSDRAARDYIRKRSIAVEKKREKRDRAFFKANLLKA